MNGASYREIAVAIYGEARVNTEPWKTSPLRDAVIALVEGGLALINGGYLQLLRQRRGSSSIRAASISTMCRAGSRACRRVCRWCCSPTIIFASRTIGCLLYTSRCV